MAFGNVQNYKEGSGIIERQGNVLDDDTLEGSDVITFGDKALSIGNLKKAVLCSEAEKGIYVHIKLED